MKTDLVGMRRFREEKRRKALERITGAV